MSMLRAISGPSEPKTSSVLPPPMSTTSAEVALDPSVAPLKARVASSSPGDQLGALAERCFCPVEELLAVDRVAAGGGGDDPDALRSEGGNPFPEAGECLDGAAHRLLAQPPLPVDALSQPGDNRVPLHLLEPFVDLVGDEEPHRVGSYVHGCDPHWTATLPDGQRGSTHSGLRTAPPGASTTQGIGQSSGSISEAVISPTGFWFPAASSA